MDAAERLARLNNLAFAKELIPDVRRNERVSSPMRLQRKRAINVS